tara:strand:- start:2881 stop:3006 length:126 start_codon:yes stop_codon:yes gene_type:complete
LESERLEEWGEVREVAMAAAASACRLQAGHPSARHPRWNPD